MQTEYARFEISKYGEYPIAFGGPVVSELKGHAREIILEKDEGDFIRVSHEIKTAAVLEAICNAAGFNAVITLNKPRT